MINKYEVGVRQTSSLRFGKMANLAGNNNNKS